MPNFFFILLTDFCIAAKSSKILEMTSGYLAISP